MRFVFKGLKMHMNGSYTLFFLMRKPSPLIFIFSHFDSICVHCIAEMTSFNWELGYGFMIYLVYKLRLI
jgi:hypothetical protein